MLLIETSLVDLEGKQGDCLVWIKLHLTLVKTSVSFGGETLEMMPVNI